MRTEVFGRCPCGGTYESRLVEIRRDERVLEDVPQGGCDLCGSRVYRADMLERIEMLMFSAGTDAVARRWASEVEPVS